MMNRWLHVDSLFDITNMSTKSTLRDSIVLGKVDMPKGDLCAIRQIERLSNLGDHLIILRERSGDDGHKEISGGVFVCGAKSERHGVVR